MFLVIGKLTHWYLIFHGDQKDFVIMIVNYGTESFIRYICLALIGLVVLMYC